MDLVSPDAKDLHTRTRKKEAKSKLHPAPKSKHTRSPERLADPRFGQKARAEMSSF
jgi:hypothetical protein